MIIPHDHELTGYELLQLVAAVKGAVAKFSVGATPLGAAIIRLCDYAAIETYRRKRHLAGEEGKDGNGS